MKPFISIILSIVLILTLSACANQTDAFSESNEDKSIETSAFSEYVGLWCESNLSWEMGGLILDVSVEGQEMKIYCSLTQSAPSSRVAEFTENIELSHIQNGTTHLSFTDDGWGNAGAVELTFNKEYILADFKDIIADDLAQWGFYENTYKLVRNDNAYTLLEYTEEDYEAKYPDTTESIISTAPTYDLSKASGILASLGMTEEEFRNSCQALNPSKYYIRLNKKTTVPFVDIVDLQRNPNAYIGQHFVFARNPFEQLPCKYCHGEDLSKVPKNSCSHGGKLHNDGLYYYGQFNINKLEPEELSGKNRFTNAYGDSVITGADDDIFLVYDLRDDIYSPTITSDSTIIAYMIFDGITSSNMLQFSMISCDITYND